jgi:hypothetical protein
LRQNRVLVSCSIDSEYLELKAGEEEGKNMNNNEKKMIKLSQALKWSIQERLNQPIDSN